MNDYRLSHQPDTSEDAVMFHELDKAMPDFYKNPSAYTWDLGEPEHLSLQFRGHHQAISQAKAAKGNPEANVRVFRAVPRGVRDINQGDWVTTSEQYARQHAMVSEDPDEDMDVLTIDTPAKNVTFGGNDAFEFGYIGESCEGSPLRRLGGSQ